MRIESGVVMSAAVRPDDLRAAFDGQGRALAIVGQDVDPDGFSIPRGHHLLDGDLVIVRGQCQCLTQPGLDAHVDGIPEERNPQGVVHLFGETDSPDSPRGATSSKAGRNVEGQDGFS